MSLGLVMQINISASPGNAGESGGRQGGRAVSPFRSGLAVCNSLLLGPSQVSLRSHICTCFE